MSAGKYSPTLSYSYAMDQKWWYKNGGGFGNGIDPDSDNDNDGYDSYGYSGEGDGPDRAGHCEIDYMSGKWIDDEYRYPLVEEVYADWRGKLAAGIKVSVD